MEDQNNEQKQNTHTEEFKLSGDQVMQKVRELIQEGNARRIIIKNDKGVSLLEIPLTIGLVGTLLAPYLAAIGAITAVIANCTIVVEKRN